MVLTNKRIEAPNKRIEAPNKRIAAPKESQFTGAISNAKYFKCHKQFVVCQRNLSWSIQLQQGYIALRAMMFRPSTVQCNAALRLSFFGYK
ncbi:hypothetical protein AC249_AIPGENE2962 [Exaiptasia diaphana]|nr:hypothetical protein AC249_AIPGENE2962 [Exaiptasia diaphana]